MMNLYFRFYDLVVDFEKEMKLSFLENDIKIIVFFKENYNTVYSISVEI